jgi:hypothetical protein
MSRKPTASPNIYTKMIRSLTRKSIQNNTALGLMNHLNIGLKLAGRQGFVVREKVSASIAKRAGQELSGKLQ